MTRRSSRRPFVQPLHPLRVDVSMSMCCQTLLSPTPTCKLCSPDNETSSPCSSAPVQSPRYYQASLHQRHKKHADIKPDALLQIKQGLSDVTNVNARLLPCMCALGSLSRWFIAAVKGLAEQVVFFFIFFFLTGILVDLGSSVIRPSQPATPATLAALMVLPQPSRPFLSPFRINIWDPFTPTTTERAVTQFLSDQIQHSTHIASLSVDVSVPLLTILEEHQTNLERFMMKHRVSKQYWSQTGRTFDSPLTNLSRLLQVPLVDFTPGSFIGKTFSHALDELDHLGSRSTRGRSLALKEAREARSHAMFWRTSSNLLLEYSSTRPRAKELLLALRAAQQYLLPILWDVDEESRAWWRSMTLSTKELRDVSAGLEIAIENLQRFIAYLDWITEHLARTSLQNQLKSRNQVDLSSCLAAFRNLFHSSKHSAPRIHCFCREEYDDIPHGGIQRIGITIPGSPTVQVR